MKIKAYLVALFLFLGVRSFSIPPVVSVTNYTTGAPVTDACINDLILYTIVNAIPGSQYVWTGNFMGSPITLPGSQPFLIMLTGTSSYTFTISVHESTSVDTTTISLPVYGKRNVSIIGPASVCVGDTVHCNTILQNSTFFLWSVNNPHAHIADTINNQAWFTFDSAGTYQVSVYAANACFDSIGYKTITVSPSPPVPSIIQNGDTLICTVTAATYGWYRNSVLQPAFTTQSIVITPADNGSWQVEIGNIFNCTSISALLSIDVGMEELAGEGVTIFPNPVSDKFTIYDLRFTISEIEIYDVLGEKRLTLNPSPNGEGLRIDVSLLAPGLYFMKLKSNSGERVAKFVKH